MNLKWYSWMRYLEWVIVTPRFHHLHHGSSEAFHNINYGAQFTIWDRLFHTFVSPDDVDPKTLEFGVNGGEKVSIVRAAIGI